MFSVMLWRTMLTINYSWDMTGTAVRMLSWTQTYSSVLQVLTVGTEFPWSRYRDNTYIVLNII